MKNSIHIAGNKDPTKNNTENEEPMRRNENENDKNPQTPKLKAFLSVDNCTGYLYDVATTSIGEFERTVYPIRKDQEQ